MKAAARRGVLAGIVAFAAIATPAQATVRQGAGSDPAGDVSAGDPYDIIAVAGKSDDAAGAAAVTIKLRAPITSSVGLVGIVGTRDGTDCAPPYVGFTYLQSIGAQYRRHDQSAFSPAQVNIDGDTVTLFATDPGLAVPYNCVQAATALSDATIVDSTAAVDLVAEAPPAPTPTPTPVPTAPPPQTTTATTPPVAVPKAAKLTVSLDGAPATIRRNRTLKLRLRVVNDGSKKSGRLQVTFAKARGLSGLGKARRLPALKPAQKRTLRLKVKLTKKARVSTKLKATVRAGKVKASSTLLLRIGKAKKVAPKGPTTKKGPLAGTFWWRTVNHVDWAWDNRALYFVDDHTVYSGFPDGGLPATCTTPPAKPDGEIDERDGCLPYTLDAKTGTLTIGDKTGTFTDGGLNVDGNGYGRLLPADAGARFTLNELRHWSFQGMCGLILGCTVTKQYLTLLPDGQFVLSRSTTSSMGDPGFGPYTYVGSFPPDQHGTYEVQAGGRIQLSYADGTVKVETFAVDTNQAGAPDPVGEGVLLGPLNFYPDS